MICSPLCLIDVVNAKLGEALDHRALGFGFGAGRSADQRSFLDALQNGSEAEKTEHKIEVPVVD
jgi:hypothetical protein